MFLNNQKPEYSVSLSLPIDNGQRYWIMYIIEYESYIIHCAAVVAYYKMDYQYYHL